MRYPIDLTPERNGISVAFPDLPEALTWGATEHEALTHAADALESALDFYFEDARPVPLPSPAATGQPSVDLPASVAATVLLHNEMLHQGVRPAELARRLDLSRSEMTRLLNFRHNTRIDTIAAALAVLGKRLELQVVRADRSSANRHHAPCALQLNPGLGARRQHLAALRRH